MEDLVVVDVVEALEDLLHHLLDLGQGELHTNIAQQAGQVVLAEVKDQVERCLVTTILTADLQQVHDVLVVQQLEDPDLSQGRDGETLLLILHQDFLQGNNFLWVGLAPGLEDLPKGALPDLGNLLILVRLSLAVWKMEFLQVAISALCKLEL